MSTSQLRTTSSTLQAVVSLHPEKPLYGCTGAFCTWHKQDRSSTLMKTKDALWMPMGPIGVFKRRPNKLRQATRPRIMHIVIRLKKLKRRRWE
jgi:hypothetical protein